MIAAVEALLRDLQGAVSARSLYPGDHPRVVEQVNRLAADSGAVLAARADVSVFWMDGRLVFDGAPLPGGEALARGVFTALRDQGFHRVTIRRGISANEFAAFVSSLADGGRAREPLRSSAHLRLSAFDSVDRPLSAPATPLVKSVIAAEHRGATARMWTGVLQKRRLDFDGLEFTMLALARTVDQSAGALLPLASMKDYDDYTVTHILNVALLAMALAEAAGFSPAQVKDVGAAALLHDMGKLSVPIEVLHAKGRLTDAERLMIRRHPEEGARMLLATPGTPELAVTVAYEHHMQYDGGGYPTVSRGWKRHVASEITHIADVFDALRTNRPYRPSLSHGHILDVMFRDSGSVFDPQLLLIFFDAVVSRATIARAED